MSSAIRPPQRAAVYARYSSDAQSEHSIDDQVRVCRVRAEHEGWMVVDIYADSAISGCAYRLSHPNVLTMKTVEP